MGNIYLVLVIVLFLLAISDLIVGVSNYAVNFLNSAIGSKVASFKVIILVAALGVLTGTVFSSGMMEVTKKVIFHPQKALAIISGILFSMAVAYWIFVYRSHKAHGRMIKKKQQEGEGIYGITEENLMARSIATLIGNMKKIIREYYHSISFANRPALEHVDNNHKPLKVVMNSFLLLQTVNLFKSQRDFVNFKRKV